MIANAPRDCGSDMSVLVSVGKYDCSQTNKATDRRTDREINRQNACVMIIFIHQNGRNT